MRPYIVILACVCLMAAFALPADAGKLSSITDTSFHLPSMEQFVRVISMRDYNTRVVLFGVTMLGLTSGVIGTFMLLRKRALMGDVAAHATFPGIGLAFIIMTVMGGTGKYLPGLLLGAFVSGILGMCCVLFIRNNSRLKEDAALGMVLSVFFGIGIAILVMVQQMKYGNAAGLESFIYGKTASMLASDAILIAVAASIVMAVCGLLYKEFRVLCFDQEFAGAQGWPVVVLDVVMMVLVVLVTVIGLQAVGLILMIALLITPAAAARFWTERLSRMVILAGIIGAASGFFGAAISALAPRLPAGAIIVLCASVFFCISMLFGPSRGVFFRLVEHRKLNRKVARQHLLRAVYEWTERHPGESMKKKELLQARSWSPRQLERLLKYMTRKGYVYLDSHRAFQLTDEGRAEAERLVRNHRLWEIYLITHADIAPSHVDRDADQIEHVLGSAMVIKLEAMLEQYYPDRVVPPSPHRLGQAT